MWHEGSTYFAAQAWVNCLLFNKEILQHTFTLLYLYAHVCILCDQKICRANNNYYIEHRIFFDLNNIYRFEVRSSFLIWSVPIFKLTFFHHWVALMHVLLGCVPTPIPTWPSNYPLIVLNLFTYYFLLQQYYFPNGLWFNEWL